MLLIDLITHTHSNVIYLVIVASSVQLSNDCGHADILPTCWTLVRRHAPFGDGLGLFLVLNKKYMLIGSSKATLN